MLLRMPSVHIRLEGTHKIRLILAGTILLFLIPAVVVPQQAHPSMREDLPFTLLVEAPLRGQELILLQVLCLLPLPVAVTRM